MGLPKKLGIGGGIILVLGLIIGWIAFPMILRSQITSASVLKKDSEIRSMWAKFPLPIDFKVYLFNVTNPLGIQNGDKPIVQEIGPYFYDEYKEKLNLVDREEDDTVEYSQRITWYFNPSKSGGLTGDEELVFPHMFLLGMLMKIAAEKPGTLGIIGKAIDSIFEKPESIFVKVKARDILFDGQMINCTVKDFAGSAVCSMLKTQSKDLVIVGDDLYKFSVFGHKNGTVSAEKMRVIRGMKNANDIGRVVEWNGLPALTIWPEDHCNAFNGTDSTIFPPYLDKDQDIVSFAPDLCRSLGARYDGPSQVKGIPANHYTANLGDMSTHQEEKCYCPTAQRCLKKGAFDLSKCVGVPIVATLPHFYLADDSYLKTVRGLQPVQEDHEIFIDFEPLTGTPMSARKRLQFNMFVYPVQKIRFTKTFASALMPLFWVEEGLELNDDFINMLKSAFSMISVVGYVKWSMVILGLGLTGAAAGLHFKRRQADSKLNISAIKPKTGSGVQSANEQKWPASISKIHAAAVPASLDSI